VGKKNVNLKKKLVRYGGLQMSIKKLVPTGRTVSALVFTGMEVRGGEKVIQKKQIRNGRRTRRRRGQPADREPHVRPVRENRKEVRGEKRGERVEKIRNSPGNISPEMGFWMEQFDSEQKDGRITRPPEKKIAKWRKWRFSRRWGRSAKKQDLIARRRIKCVSADTLYA